MSILDSNIYLGVKSQNNIIQGKINTYKKNIQNDEQTSFYVSIQYVTIDLVYTALLYIFVILFLYLLYHFKDFYPSYSFYYRIFLLSCLFMLPFLNMKFNYLYNLYRYYSNTSHG